MWPVPLCQVIRKGFSEAVLLRRQEATEEPVEERPRQSLGDNAQHEPATHPHLLQGPCPANHAQAPVCHTVSGFHVSTCVDSSVWNGLCLSICQIHITLSPKFREGRGFVLPGPRAVPADMLLGFKEPLLASSDLSLHTPLLTSSRRCIFVCQVHPFDWGSWKAFLNSPCRAVSDS